MGYAFDVDAFELGYLSYVDKVGEGMFAAWSLVLRPAIEAWQMFDKKRPRWTPVTLRDTDGGMATIRKKFADVRKRAPRVIADLTFKT